MTRKVSIDGGHGRGTRAALSSIGLTVATADTAKMRFAKMRQRNRSSSLSADKVSGTTCRRVPFQIDNVAQRPAYAGQALARSAALKSASSEWYTFVLKHPSALAVYRELERIARPCLTGTYFRGRCFPADSSPGPTDFGPPPTLSAGRYSAGSQPVLYLARSEACVAEEVRPTPEKPELWVQRFEPAIKSRCVLLDRSLGRSAPYLDGLLNASEYIIADSPFGNPYAATHLVAAMCNWLNIVGVEYPSVASHIPDGDTMVNLVVFGASVAAVAAAPVGDPLRHSVAGTG